MDQNATPSQSDASIAAVWIVVPAYNEAARISSTLAGLCERYKQVVVVDDGSTDQTRAVVARYPVWYVRHVANCGQGAALQTGIDFAVDRGAEIVVTFDADGQHNAGDIETLLAPIRTGRVDVCLGSRFLGQAIGIPPSRWLTLKLGVLVTRLLSRLRLTDTHNGLRALSRMAALRLRMQENGMAHASEILDQIGRLRLSYCEVPVRIRYSRESLRHGQSSWNALCILGRMLIQRVLQ